MPPLQNLRTFRFITRFRCIADKCEDLCCRGLKVFLTPAETERLGKAMSTQPADRVEFATKVQRLPFPPNAQVTNSVATREEGACSFLAPDKLCSLVNRYGEPVLADCCALYPRRFVRTGETVQVTATLGCPEMARLCLATDDAVDWVVPTTELASREPQSLSAMGTHELMRGETLRSTGFTLLSLPQVTLSRRLCLLAGLATFIDAQDVTCSSFGEAVSTWLQSALSLKLPSPLEPSNALRPSLLWLLAAETRGNARFRELWTKISESYFGTLAHCHISHKQAESASFEDVAKLYDLRATALRAQLPEAQERWFRNFALTSWGDLPLGQARPATSAVLELVLRLVTVRLMLHGHPLLCAKLESQPSSTPAAVSEFQLEQIAVEVIQCFTKYVDCEPDVLANLVQLVLLQPALFGENPLQCISTLAQLC